MRLKILPLISRKVPTLKGTVVDKFGVQTTIITSIDVSFEDDTMDGRRNALTGGCIFDFQ